MKSHPYSAFFWILTENTALSYVVTMADLKQNQQNRNLWAGCLTIIPEWKIFLICEIFLQDHNLIDGEFSVLFQR